MKKIILTVLASAVLICVLSFGAFAEMQGRELLDETQDELFSLFDRDTEEALEKLGIDSLNPAKIYNISFSNIVEYFSTDLSQKFSEALKSFFVLISIVMITAAARTYAGTENDFGFELVCLMMMSMTAVSKLEGVINTVLSVVDLSGKFMLGYIPVFAGVIAFGGNPASALTYNTVTLAFAEGISAFTNSIAIPAVGAFYCLCISFSVGGSINLSRFVSAFGKASSFLMGLMASLFTALLSVKGIMSCGVDTVSAKGIRFVISSMIPVVGGAISEAYGAVVGSIGLIKSSVAVVGIIAGLVINIPAALEALMYYLALSAVSFFSDALGMSGISALLHAFAVGIKFLLLLLVYEMFILIISTGIMLTFKGG